MPPSEFAERWESAAPRERVELLRARFRWDLEGFCRFCWPDRFELPFNDLHRDLFDVSLSRGSWDERTDNVLDAVAAPRGYAKSTISTFAAACHRIVYGLEAFIVLVSAESELAVDFSTDLKAAFDEVESPLAAVFGPFRVTGGVKGWQVSVRGGRSVAVLPRSERSAIRGRKHPKRGIRPTLFILDDVEDKLRVLNPRLRRFTWSWLTKDVLKAGVRSGMLSDVWFRGTVLHQDAALARLVGGLETGWATRRYKAILRWPDRADLWDRCRLIWSDLTLGKHRVAMATAFYRANRAEMERGAEILGGLDGPKSLFDLYAQIWAGGMAAFLQEMQNDPVDPAAQIFVSQGFARFRIDGPDLVLATGRRVPWRSLRRTAYWDPSLGNPDGDFACIAIVGRDQWGYGYVLGAWMERAKPDAQLAAAWTLAERWDLNEIVYEDNGFQALVEGTFQAERAARRQAGQFSRLHLRGETSTDNKNARIVTLQPDTVAGWLQFAEGLPHELWGQFDAFPNADHDDGPDAIQRAWAESGGTPIRMEG